MKQPDVDASSGQMQIIRRYNVSSEKQERDDRNQRDLPKPTSQNLISNWTNWINLVQARSGA